MKKYFIILTFILIPSLFSACSSLFIKEDEEILSHPVIEKARPLCTNCHDKKNENLNRPYEFFNHTQDFIQQHKIYAVQKIDICRTCHKESFCAQCHTANDATRPNLKNGDRPDKIYPHKGDYLIRHRIEGKILSDNCFGCHGRKNNKTCLRCHKN